MNSKRKIYSASKLTYSADWKLKTRNTLAPGSEGPLQPYKYKKTDNGVRKGLFQSPLTITCASGRKMVLRPVKYDNLRPCSAENIKVNTPQSVQTAEAATETESCFLKPTTPHTPLQASSPIQNRTFTPETPHLPFDMTADIAQLPSTPQLTATPQLPATPQISVSSQQAKVDVAHLILFSPIDEETPPNTLCHNLVTPSQCSTVSTPPTLQKTGSNEDFLRLEALCKTPVAHNHSYMSPLSSVCNLFQNNMVLNSVRKQPAEHPKTKKEILDRLDSVLQDNKEIENLLKELNKKRQENDGTIFDLVKQLGEFENDKTKIKNCQDKKDDSNESPEKMDDKENSVSIKRRSLRISKKNVKGHSPGGSPVVLKSGDLRKSTLTKSLVTKCQKYQIATPRINKGLEMYNAKFRSTCSSLLTPKIRRKSAVASPETNQGLSSLSLKVQQQCIMLQDTPMHK